MQPGYYWATSKGSDTRREIVLVQDQKQLGFAVFVTGHDTPLDVDDFTDFKGPLTEIAAKPEGNAK